MEYIVTEAIKGVRDGEIYPVKIQVGETVTGDLGLTLYNAGYAEKVNDKTSGESRTTSRAGDAGAGKKPPKTRRKRKPRKSS